MKHLVNDLWFLFSSGWLFNLKTQILGIRMYTHHRCSSSSQTSIFVFKTRVYFLDSSWIRFQTFWFMWSLWAFDFNFDFDFWVHMEKLNLWVSSRLYQRVFPRDFSFGCELYIGFLFGIWVVALISNLFHIYGRVLGSLCWSYSDLLDTWYAVGDSDRSRCQETG